MAKNKTAFIIAAVAAIALSLAGCKGTPSPNASHEQDKEFAFSIHLGDSLWDAGDTESARYYYRHALSISHDPEFKAIAAERIMMLEEGM